ncbi:MAG: bifunctional tRNA (5-methylaminomethyl-2-thiouridine)(34)-methyltransferase MnmD/FAD-dependent 5-carboxymethylaminomethyl-2-thiouridine(34) oxidoreductase MnmC [Spirochaetia bacterium]|nr:bifunctional tRNA (5-methylaminomethyl-2-thiouridine)(34)-methyltransferase MnmD/FAD-dependent 5-carboxymethylaminomethyl-2-thiouridine(34) oxidoreductase MnmC [Spirochaetia bacterium]
MKNSNIKTAEVDFYDGAIYSKKYKDIYFSKEGAIEESEYVFLQNNNLHEKLAEPSLFTIGELGFGFGVNFLCAYKLFRKKAHNKTRLYYVSCEKYPVNKTTLIKVLSGFSAIKEEAEELIEKYPPLISNYYLIPFFEGRVNLILMIGDALETFSSFGGEVNAWFFDGFSPAKNSSMWSKELFSIIAQKSAPNAAFSTYTSAGFVKRALEETGFAVYKKEGFGKKRDMLHGYLKKNTKDSSLLKPWFILPKTNTELKKAIIIGAGIAGAAAAFSLIKRGFNVQIIEKEFTGSMKASSNPTGIIKPILNIGQTAMSKISLTGFHYTKSFLKTFQLNKYADFSGILQLAYDNKNKNRLREVLENSLTDNDFARWVNSKEASKIAGIPIEYEGLYLPSTGRGSMFAVTNHLLSNNGITFINNTEAAQIKQIEKNNTNVWQVYDSSKKLIAEAPVLIIASAYDTLKFDQTSWLPLSQVRGQTCEVLSSTESQKLKIPLISSGFISPCVNGHHISASTFSRKNMKPELNKEDYKKLISMAKQNISSVKPAKNINGWAGFRTASSDFIPLAGCIPDKNKFYENYYDLHLGRTSDSYPLGDYFSGLFVSTGHGSHGFIYAMLSAEVIASIICGEPLPLANIHINVLNPARFLIRDLLKPPEKRRVY